MNHRTLSVSARLLLLGWVALTCQGDTPALNCEEGTSVQFVTTALARGGLSDAVIPRPSSPVAHCSVVTMDAGKPIVKVFEGNGGKGDKVIAIGSPESFKKTLEEAKAEYTTAKENNPSAPQPAAKAAETAQASAAATAKAAEGAKGQNGPSCLGVVLPQDPTGNTPGQGTVTPVNPPIVINLPTIPNLNTGPATPPGRSPASAGTPLPAVNPPTTPTAPAQTNPSAGVDPVAVPATYERSPAALPGGVFSQTTSNVIETLVASEQRAVSALGSEIIHNAQVARKAMSDSARDDQTLLGNIYRTLPTDALSANLLRAQNAANEAVEVLENAASSTLESSERTRFRNYFLNARDKAQLGIDAIREDQKAAEQLGAESFFGGFLQARDANPLAKSPALAGIFGQQTLPANSATPDALVNRMVMLNGLPEEQRAATTQKLKLLERPTFTMSDGRRATLDLPHNGYLLGGGNTAVDCSSFVSFVLPADVRRGRFTTLDFRSMWIYDRTEEFPSPPKYTPEREKLVKEIASAFIAIDVYAGETLRSGDLLIYRLQDEPLGHIVIVRSYNAVTWRADVIEAAQSASTIRERSLSLSPDALDAPKRVMMPGLYVLRLKPTNNHACYYRDGSRSPASSSPPYQPTRPGEAGGNAGGAL